MHRDAVDTQKRYHIERKITHEANEKTGQRSAGPGNGLHPGDQRLLMLASN